LTQAEQERMALLEEVRGEIARMREEAEQRAAALQAESRRLQAEAARLHEEARLLHAGAEEAGYATGIGQAQVELEHFRTVMGESVGAVLSAVHAQCDCIFSVWKEDLCALLLACVEKGTGLVLDRDRTRLLEQLLLDSVRLFEARSSVLVRVQPDDEAVVADMFAAAKERIPGLGSWSVQGDPDLAPGDLVLEAAHSRVESRIEERRNAVDAALRHVLLPVAPEEEHGREDLARVNAEAVARMLELVPQRPLAPVAPQAEEMRAEPQTSESSAALSETEERDDPEAAAEQEAPAMPDDSVASALSSAPKVDLNKVWSRPETADTAVLDTPDAMDAVDAVLAEGGFLPATEEA
jgi:flagellar assembly protein FliH